MEKDKLGQAVWFSEWKTVLWLRIAGRWCGLVAAVALAWPFGSEAWTSVLLPSLSPYVAVCAAVAVRSLSFITLLGLPVLVLVLLFHRWFCRNACPTGLLLELAGNLRPTAPWRWMSWPLIGRWCALLTLGGALVGYPVFLWLDPLAIFNGFFSAWRQPATVATLCAGVALPVLLVLELVLPRAWCARLCPLGATQELLALRRQPASLLGQRPCSISPPSLAMAKGREKRMVGRIDYINTPEVRSPVLARRGFIALCAGAACGFAAKAARGQSPPLRPPGAIEEQRFTGVCVRCGSCIRVCPTRILQPDLAEHGLASLLTPVARFDDGYCNEDCNRCNQLCPSGAIARLSLAEKRRRVIGPAKLDLDVCLLANGGECTACIRACPYEALSVSSDGFASQPRLDLAKCTGCGACEAACPTQPVRSIRVVPGGGVLPEAGPRREMSPPNSGSPGRTDGS